MGRKSASALMVAAAFGALTAASCSRINYHEVRTPITTEVKQQNIQFTVNSDPSGADVFVDSTAVGTSPVMFQAPMTCNQVTYESKWVGKAWRTGADIGVGAGLLAGALIFGLGYGLNLHFNPEPDEETGNYAALGVITGGLFIPGIALFIRGLVYRGKHDKVKKVEQKTLEECPDKKWKLILAKNGYMPAERIIGANDLRKDQLIALTPATILGTSAPAAAVDKLALLASMAEKTDAMSGQQDLSQGSQAVVEARMKTLPAPAAASEGYELAGDDFFFAMGTNDIKMLEMTTEKDYCYVITAVVQPSIPIYMAVFQKGEEIKKDFIGRDMAEVQFCSNKSQPVRVTMSSYQPTAVALRIHFLAE